MQMIYTIANDRLKIAVSDRGGELQSVKDRMDSEYLWQGDPAYWAGKALNLFPYIGRLTKGQYLLDEKRYHMGIHGFVYEMQMVAEEQKEDRISFRLDAGEDSKKQYPYEFTYRICYELCENSLCITYEVENKDDKTMYFGIGGHPGFCVPLEENLVFEDYFIEFSNPCKPLRIGFSKECFLDGTVSEYPLTQGNKIELRHGMFDQDAIVLQNTGREVTLKSGKGKKAVRVSYPDMAYLGLWHVPRTKAPYLCIEPWSSLPARQDVVENLSMQPGLIRLPAGQTYRNRWMISIM